MTTYKTGRPNIKSYILYQLLGIVCLFLVLLICQYAFPQYQFLKKSTYLLFGILIPLSLLFEIKKERIYEISFDHDKQQISFSYKTSAFSKLKNYDLPYGFAKVEKSENTSLIKWFWPPSIYFSKNKLEIFEVTKWKDGFSKDVLNEIYKACVQTASTQPSKLTA